MTGNGPRRFDALVIGAGSAGSLIAARLSENSDRVVGVVEAGGPADDPAIADPLAWPTLGGKPYDWAYRTTPQPGTAGRSHDWPRGRVLGGSSCLHAMAWVRGHPDDFAPWAEAGGPDWSFDGLLPAFRRIETAPPGSPPALRGADGPMPVLLPDAELSPVTRAYMAAGLALGAPWIGDHNNGSLLGVAPNSLTIRDGRRVSAADAWLAPALSRPNLVVLTETLVERLEIVGDRVESVVARRGAEAVSLSASTVILCLGAIGSPLLLMRSGVGDPETLATAGIRCRIALPGVGRDLQDHLLVLGVVFRAKRPVPPSRLQHSESLMYLRADGPARCEGPPDVALACVVGPSAAPGLAAPEYGAAFTILCGATHPTSRGTIRPTGPLSEDAPEIDPRYLETPEDRDGMLAAVSLAREIGWSAELGGWRDAEVLPGPNARSKANLAAFIARAASTHHHPAGTCRMGRDVDAVVDPRLKVRGLANVSVVDASVLPTLPCGPIHAATLAIAEAFAERAGTTADR